MEKNVGVKRKGKKVLKRIIWAVVILAVVGAVVFAVVSIGNAKGAYDEEKVLRGDITTYYSFSGVIEAKNHDEILADKAMQIKEVLVAEGDKVKKDDELFKTTFGEKILATMDGTISTLYVEQDSQVMAGLNLVDIVDYNHLMVNVKVDEYDLGSVAVKKKVQVTINALEKVVSGKISKISREATNSNGLAYFTADVDLKYNKALRVGMSTEVRILNKQVKKVLTVSMKAVQFDASNKPFVLLKDAKGAPVSTYITTGMNDGNIVEVKKGLKVGQTVLSVKKVATTSGFMPPRTNTNTSSGTGSGSGSGTGSGSNTTTGGK